MSTPQMNPTDLQAEQKQVWDKAAGQWAEATTYLQAGGQTVSDRLIALAHIASGQRVLDIATGTGDPALSVAQVVGPTGSVVGIDQAPQMLVAARNRAAAAGLSNVTFIEGNAQTVDLPPQSFDAVVSRWGLMFFIPLVPALEGFRRVLRPGGYLSAAVWGPPQQVPVISAATAAIYGELGIPLPPPDAPGPFNLADANRLAQNFAEAGFANVQTEPFTMSATFPSAETFANAQRSINQRIAPLIAEQPAERQPALWQTVTQVAQRMASPDGSVTLHNLCICVSAQA